ncbi:Tn3 family transposase, partial [Enterobacter hormaechei]
SEASARVDDLPVSISAVLMAEACNIGLEPLIRSNVPALTRHRLNWGARRIRKKSYAKVFRASVRAETSRLPVCGSAARRNRRLG